MPDDAQRDRVQGGGPLADIRVLAVEQFGAGPFATLQLADLGADVVKIEDPTAGGDVARSVPPGRAGDTSLYFETFNRGKRSIALDLKNAEGRSVFERLVTRADVVFNNLRGDLPDKLGLTYRSLSRLNARIICASLSAYGRDDERAAEPGYDALMQAEAGWAQLTGEPGGAPVKSGLSLVDYAAGLVAALGIVSAVHDARRTGRGRDVDVSLYDTALAMLTYPATWWLSAGVRAARQPMSAHPSIVPFQFFRTADGYIAIACAKEHFWTRLVEALADPHIGADERFARFDGRHEHRAELLARLEVHFAGRSTAHWIELLRGNVPCAAVRSMEEALDLDALERRAMSVMYEHPALGVVRTVGTPLRMGGYAPHFGPGPGLGEDRQALLRELDVSAEEESMLSEAGAFGPHRSTTD